MSLAVSASADTPSSGTVSHPDTDYDLGSATLHGQTWVGGETYGGDPNHNCTFHTETCDTEELWDCLHGGVRFLVCRTCGKKYVSARMKPQPHNYAIQVDASGNCTMTCTRCGDTCTQKLTQKNPDRYSMSLQINGFTFVHGEEYGGDPNHGCNLQSPSVPSGAATVWDCPNGGVSLIICADCHKIYVGAILGPIEHSYQEEVVTPATATAPGLKTFTCSNCGDSYSETIPQLSGSAPAVPETPESSVTRDPSATAAVSTNVNAQNYTVWSQPVTSYLYARQDGNLTRVEALSDGVAVEIYDSSYHLLSSRKIPMELSLFGGFFAGKNYNFLIFGQSNPDENDRQEVVRVVRYSKDWERQSQCSMYGADTTIPFEDGSLRCAESQGMLYILTCHKHYKSEDGLNHQSNMTVEIRQSDMTITDQFYEVDNPGSGYVSHSFNQFILVDQENRLVTLNHGDAYPRSAAVHQYQNQASEEKFFGYYGTKMDPGLEFAGGTGLNATGASVGGLASSGDCYLAVCNTIIQDSQYKSRKTRNVVLTVTDKTTMGSRGTVQLTNYPEGSPESASTPQIVPITDNRFLVLWNIMSSNQSSIPRPRHEIGYVFINGQGQPQGAVQTAAANLSDCQPILVNGQVI